MPSHNIWMESEWCYLGKSQELTPEMHEYWTEQVEIGERKRAYATAMLGRWATAAAESGIDQPDESTPSVAKLSLRTSDLARRITYAPLQGSTHTKP